MNRDEALTILQKRIRALRSLSYVELLPYLNNPRAEEVIGSSGQPYQIEVEAMWDAQPDSDLRVLASIDDGSLRWTITPLVEDFIVRSDGTFVGE